jgi:cell division protein FtsZ
MEIDGLPLIKVVGVGGGGSNAVNRLVEQRIPGIELIALNTDAQALSHSAAPTRIRIGDRLTKGLGVGGDPSKGARAAEESHDEIYEALRGAEMVFVTAGLGGGTGTGAAPIVGQVAKELGALTVAVVTKPFSFEGAKRQRQAEEGAVELQDKVDTLIAIPNDRLLSICSPDVSIDESFRTADDVLRQGIQGIAEIITRPGDINLDFNDVRTIMQEGGPAMMGVGCASGQDRALEAARQAISSPLLDIDIRGARGVLFSIAGSSNLGLHEVSAAANVVSELIDAEANFIFGTTIDPTLGDDVQVTVIATGFVHTAHMREREVDERIRALRMDSLQSLSDTELPTFLRRTVASR